MMINKNNKYDQSADNVSGSTIVQISHSNFFTSLSQEQLLSAQSAAQGSIVIPGLEQIGEERQKRAGRFLGKLIETAKSITNKADPDQSELRRHMTSGPQGDPCAVAEDTLAATLAAARLDDESTQTLLINLLVDRSTKPEKTLSQIAMTKAITVVPELTNQHLDALALIYLMRYYYSPFMTSRAALESAIDSCIMPLTESGIGGPSTASHLAALGCTTPSNRDVAGIEQVIIDRYPLAAMEGFNKARYKKEISQLGDQATAYINDKIAPSEYESSNVCMRSPRSRELLDKELKRIGFSQMEFKAIRNTYAAMVMNQNRLREYLQAYNESMGHMTKKWRTLGLAMIELTPHARVLALKHLELKTSIPTSPITDDIFSLIYVPD